MTETASSSNSALVYAFLVDGKGSGTPLDWTEIQSPPPAEGLTWIHLDLSSPEAAAFVRQRSGIEEDAADILLAEHTRPRLVAFDEWVEEGRLKETNAALADLRRTFIGLRRYLTPQRDALLRLAAAKLTWLAEDDRNWLREIADQTTRYLEALEAARDRATVTQEELLQRLSEKAERRMYLLSVVTAVFLPLGLITGLLGVNVGGIPGTETPWAFLFLCVITVGLVGLELWFLRRNQWF